MALIMVAIGGLLTLIGVYAVATGLPVIEIERGWSMVISGSVLVSGGFIVAALGIVVRTLNGLKGGLAAQPVVPATAPAAAAPAPLQEPAIAPPAFAVRPPAPMPAAKESVPAFAVAAPAAAAVLAAGAGYAATHHGPEAPEPVHEPEPDAHEIRDHEPPTEEPPAPADPAPVHAAADPLSHDWLEREFAAFDLDAPHQPAAVPTPEPPHAALQHPEPPAQEPRADMPPDHQPPEPVAAHEPETAHVPEAKPEPVAEAPSTAPDAPDRTLTVIGRYDSDGTSYVMYSDGSIEAQSESGVFRFGSMAELKAFIEG